MVTGWPGGEPGRAGCTPHIHAAIRLVTAAASKSLLLDITSASRQKVTVTVLKKAPNYRVAESGFCSRSYWESTYILYKRAKADLDENRRSENAQSHGKDFNDDFELENFMIFQDIQKIREKVPLIHNITNYVVMNFTANALLALGASPVMAHAPEEVEDMAELANALVVNLGTPSIDWINSMIKAGHIANHLGTPIVLDPVGSGATRFRTESAQLLLRNTPPSFIRGNASEIRSLVLAEQCTKGVDSVHKPEETLESAQFLSKNYHCVVSISGATDLVVEDNKVMRIGNGHPIMSRVTGMGCVATALTAAFAAVNASYFHAAANAMALIGIAGELAAERCHGPGSFQAAFMDALYNIQASDIEGRLKMEME
jgi:hydroxyethylthiazole kinase